MGTFVGAVVFPPAWLLVDYFAFLKKLDGRDAQITQASHGVMMMILAGYAWEHGIFPHEYPYQLGLLFSAGWGLFWLILGANRSRFGYRDGRLIGRAVAKVGLGAGVYFWLLPQ
jgi:hypothetical protein